MAAPSLRPRPATPPAADGVLLRPFYVEIGGRRSDMVLLAAVRPR